MMGSWMRGCRLLIDKIPSIRILGVKVHLPTMNQALLVIDQWIINRDKCRHLIASGMHGVMEARSNCEFRTVAEECDIFIPDGFSLVFIAKLRGFKTGGRVSGPDLMLRACQHAADNGYSVYFLGDTPETLDLLVSSLTEKLPDLKVSGYYSPPFRSLTELEKKEIIDTINNSQTDILWVGLGLPKQEMWIYEHKHNLNVPVAIGVGAAFKFISGQVKRAPHWIGNNGFEWLWRLLLEPKRVWKRVLITGPHFVFCIVKESLDGAALYKTK